MALALLITCELTEPVADVNDFATAAHRIADLEKVEVKMEHVDAARRDVVRAEASLNVFARETRRRFPPGVARARRGW